MFNYHRAFSEFLTPEFLRLYPLIFYAYAATKDAAATLKQVGSTSALANVSDSLINAYATIRPETLARASEIVYWYGHYSPSKHGEAQEHGLYWKFQILARQSLIERGHNALMRQESLDVEMGLRTFNEPNVATDNDCVRENIFDK